MKKYIDDEYTNEELNNKSLQREVPDIRTLKTWLVTPKRYKYRDANYMP